MNRPGRSIVPVLLGAVLSAQVSEKVRLHRWGADIDAFASRYSAGHPAPFRCLPQAEFRRRMMALKQDLPTLKDHEIAARWAKVLADLGDEHTEIDFSTEFGARSLPVEIETFSDGTFVVGAEAPFQDLLGARLEHVEGQTLEGLRRALKPYVAFAQEGWFRHVFDESFGTWPLLMDAAGIVKVKETWTLDGIGVDGRRFSLDVPVAPDSPASAWEWEVRQDPPMLRDQQPRAAFFFRALEAEKAVYVRLRRCDDDRRRPFRRVLAGALGALRNDRLERLIVDLRGNTGGSEALVERLVSALRREPPLRGAGKLLVLTDGAVFSAAAVAAWRLRHEAGAFLVGEACGAGPNHIGAVEEVRLPSGRIASFGTEIHIIDRADPEDFKSPILPDLEVRIAHADVLKGRDPVLAAALGKSTMR